MPAAGRGVGEAGREIQGPDAPSAARSAGCDGNPRTLTSITAGNLAANRGKREDGAGLHRATSLVGQEGGRVNRARHPTSIPRRGFSLSLGPNLGKFRQESIEQTGREKPIGVGITRTGEGAQVEARPRKFIHLVDDNP
jgi:hypothetical protein